MHKVHPERAGICTKEYMTRLFVLAAACNPAERALTILSRRSKNEYNL